VLKLTHGIILYQQVMQIAQVMAGRYPRWCGHAAAPWVPEETWQRGGFIEAPTASLNLSATSLTW
jgi:hypothetical protein